MNDKSFPSHIIYLHGFQSSSRSQKSTEFGRYLKQHPELSGVSLVSPNLPFSPAGTLALVEDLLKQYPEAVLIGSSMGGFYAGWCSQEFLRPAVLINPVADASSLFSSMLGQELENIYTGEKHIFTEGDLSCLEKLAGDKINNPDLIYVLLETGDEVLDYRLAEKKYRICSQKIIQGGDHRFQHFEECLPEIMSFYQGALGRLSS